MARGNKILVSAEPKGHFTEGYISGSGVKPGMIVERDLSLPMIGGRHGYRVYQPGTDGERREVIIVLEDYLQGRLASDAYSDGDHIFLYSPVAGDEMNILLLNLSGTADDHLIGEMVMPDTGTGKFIATTGSPEMEPFRLLEAVTDPTADTLAWAVCTGR